MASNVTRSVDAGSILSTRGQKITGNTSLLEDGFMKCYANPYDENTNPEGVINAGTAENTISQDLIAEKLSQLKPPYLENPDLLRYQNFAGIEPFRKTLASFLTKYAKAPTELDPDNLMVANGCGSCITMLSTVLCDPGDAWLIPSPYYGAILDDSYRLPQVNVVQVDLNSQVSEENGKPFQLTVDKLEHALQQATLEGVNVRGLFLMNPGNPIGDIFSEQLLKDCLEFASRHKLHVILDEIYMLSVFDETTPFVSVLSLDNLPDPDRTHFIWGFSKDLCMSGLRCGAIYTTSKQVMSALQRIVVWFSFPTAMQYILNDMLRDEEWLAQKYLPTNHQRLREAYATVSGGLKKLGIPFLETSACLFIWMDFRKVVSTFEAEIELFNEFIDAGIYITPGQGFFCVEPGWFRIIFSLPIRTLQIAIDKIGTVLERRKQKLASIK